MRGYFPGESEREAPPPGPGGPPQSDGAAESDGAVRRARGGRIDWVVGIALGIVVGVAVVVVFVFFGSEETIDAPSVDGNAPAARQAPATTAPNDER